MPFLNSLIARLPYPTPAAQRAVAVAAVVTQAGIGVTGSVVRVTGSGLGCPTWPQCVAGSMVPVEHGEYEALNQWIEFTNRMLTGVVIAVAALCMLTAWRIQHQHPNRRRLVRLAWMMPAGVVLQAVVGGITVLAKLEWWTVAIHFLASIPLIWLAVLLLHAFKEGDHRPHWLIAPVGRKLLIALVITLGAVLIAGTTVTGAGPHGGDTNTHRFALPVEQLAKVHGGLLVAYLLILTALGATLFRTGVSATLLRRYVVTFAVALLQGGLGSLQYFLGVPEALVSFHVLGSALVVVATGYLWCAARDRGQVAERQPHSSSDKNMAATA